MKTLYRRNNNGRPCFWKAYPNNIRADAYDISYGIVGNDPIINHITTNRDVKKEIESKYNEKRKQGYKYLNELRDDTRCSPVKEQELLNYLNTYLPYDRTTSNGVLLPMLAKVYDNDNNKVFKKCSYYIGQYKINGLRCFISAHVNTGDMFKPIGLRFQSREGTIWTSLSNLEEYLLSAIPKEIINKMLDENWHLDGEIYLPGYSVNEINHFVKDPNCFENKLLQYWCYDIAINDAVQYYRNVTLTMYKTPITFGNKQDHLNNKERFLVLPTSIVDDDYTARKLRRNFIDYGFEGLILRNPNAEYQYGKRNMSMIKFKDTTDGIFKIIDIYKEGTKRDIPLFLCENDINNEQFEVHINGTFDYQREILENKEQYIGRMLYISFGERSGVNKVPFHVKVVKFL